MIKRLVFVEEYSVWDGMTWVTLQELKRRATEALMEQVNAWKSKQEAIKIISIQEESFTSRNSDHSPFWIKLIIMYEEE